MTSVALAYLHPGYVAHAFMASVLMTIDRHPGLDVWPIRSGPLAIPESRNSAAGRALDDDAVEWLWFVDSDIGFGGEMLAGLLSVADAQLRPVITVPYVAVIDGPEDGLGGHVPQLHPSVYRFAQPRGVTSLTLPLPEGVFRVDACGAGMLLIHRNALALVGPDPFARIDGQGEDISFCRRLAEREIPLHACTTLRCTHYKATPLG